MCIKITVIWKTHIFDKKQDTVVIIQSELKKKRGSTPFEARRHRSLCTICRHNSEERKIRSAGADGGWVSGINIISQRFNCEKPQSKSGITKTIKALLRHCIRRYDRTSLVKNCKDTPLTKRSAPEDSRIAASVGMRALQSAISKRLVKN